MDAGKGNKESDGQKQGQEVGGGMIVAVKRKVPPTKPTRSSARLRNQWLPFEVFDNELLRKKILGCAVFSGGNKEEYRKTACSLRLVGKTWNETVIKLLYKRQEPLITLYAGGLENGKLLERFSNIFSTSIPLNGYIPPFSVQIDYLWSENVNAFWNLLTHCGEGLVQLNIGPVIRWLSCKGQYSNLSLPRLHKLDIFISWDSNVGAGEVTSGQDGEETVFSIILNSVARNSRSIDELTVTLPFNCIERTSQLSSLSLPRNITNLKLLGKMKDEHVELLVRKPIPNLMSLTLSLEYQLLGSTSFFRILDTYRASLKKLTIEKFENSLRQTSFIRFPIMDNLDELFFDSNNLELELGLVSLERSLPKLRTLRLGFGSAAILRKWTSHSKFMSVTNLQIALGSLESLNMETMQRVNFALPNLRILDMSFPGMATSGLKYVFREMTQLTELKLRHYCRVAEANPDFWDAILTGVSFETVAESRQDPGYWERFDRNGGEALESIRNLQELTSLTLGGYWLSNHLAPFFSDITFQRALLKMPNLKRLILRCRFKASTEIAEEWRSGGRLLEYSGY